MASDTDQGIAEGVRWLIEQQTLVRAPKREPLPTPISSGGSMMTVAVAASDASALSKGKADFQAIGADDQVMLRRASAAAGPGGGTLWLSEGVFRCNVDALITFIHYGVVRGMGRDATEIRVDGGGSGDTFLELMGDTILRDLTISEDGTPSRLVKTSANGCSIDNVTLENFNGTALIQTAGANLAVSNSNISGDKAVDLEAGFDAHFDNCRIEGDTFGIDAGGFGGPISIVNNTIFAQTGILATCNLVYIAANLILGTDGRGIDLDAVSLLLIEGNTIREHNGAAIYLNACTRPKVMGNQIFDVNRNANDVAAVVIDGTGAAILSRGGSCSGNDIDATSGTGIRILDGYSNFVIDDNKLTRVREHGIWASDLKHSQIHSNHVAWLDNMADNNTWDGIILDGDSDLNSLQQNTIRAEDTSLGTPGTRYGINISASTCNSNVVTNNFCYLVSDFQSGPYNDAGTGTMKTVAGTFGDNRQA